MDVSITELRANLRANLERVRAGESIVITDHGKPVAKLVAATTEDHLAQLEAQGLITRPKGPKRPLRPRIKAGDPSVSFSDTIIEHRGG